MKKVFKYELSYQTDLINVELPIGAEVLTIDTQKNKLCLWVSVDPDELVMEIRQFRIAGTGHSIYEEPLKYINTIQIYDGDIILHLFEVLK